MPASSQDVSLCNCTWFSLVIVFCRSICFIFLLSLSLLGFFSNYVFSAVVFLLFLMSHISSSMFSKLELSKSCTDFQRTPVSFMHFALFEPTAVYYHSLKELCVNEIIEEFSTNKCVSIWDMENCYFFP